MLHSKGDIDREIRRALKEAGNVEALSAQEWTALVEKLRQRIVLAIVEEGRLDASTLQLLKAKVGSILSDYRNRFEQALTENQRRLFVKGIQIVDRTIAGAGLTKAVPYLSEQTLQQLQKYSADLVTGLTDQIRDQITREITLAVLGQKSTQKVVDEIGKNLTGPSIFGTIARRADVIVRTEMHRVQSLATAERIQQVGQQITDLKKVWLHSHLGVPRPGHLVLDGTTVDSGAKFTLIGGDGVTYKVSGPYDPVLPAGETINCRCEAIPVVGRFQKIIAERT